MPYCKLCGNEPDESDGVGLDCLARIASPQLARAYAFWVECAERYDMCCGGMSCSKDGLYFHGDGWECSYPLTKKGKPRRRGPQVAVEMGVRFEMLGAYTYYIRDFGHYSDSEDFGEMLEYPSSVEEDDPEVFWAALDAQLDQAAECAWNGDLRSKPNGDHESLYS